MKTTILTIILSFALMLNAQTTQAAVAPGDDAPDFTLTTATGETVSLKQYAEKTVILEWVNFDCPFVKKHYASGNMSSLQKLASENNMVWLSVCSSAPSKQGNFTGETLKQRIKKEGSAATAYLIDEDGSTGKAYGAKVTPHFFIIQNDKIVYAGGVDSIRSTDQADIAKASPYVKDAIESLAAAKPIANSDTEAYGCSIKY